ncbi:MAG: hypothetical protein ACYDHH_25330 [Solirubrobacteraceae bacterium]
MPQSPRRVPQATSPTRERVEGASGGFGFETPVGTAAGGEVREHAQRGRSEPANVKQSVGVAGALGRHRALVATFGAAQSESVHVLLDERHGSSARTGRV